MLEAISIIFWGLLLLMLIVFVHELGHFLTARMFGVRVKEFMLGLPGPSIGFKRGETRYGVTCIPLGGYARIAGMEGGEENPNLAKALSYLAYFGQLSLADVQRSSEKLGFDLEEALDVLDEWGTVIRKKDRELGYFYAMPAVEAIYKQDKRRSKMDANAGHLGSESREQLAELACKQGETREQLADATHKLGEPQPELTAIATYKQGEPRPMPDADEFINAERAQTYRKLKWWQRIVVLVAGAGFNLIFAIVILSAVIMYTGQTVATTTVDSVLEGSPAAEAGIRPGDKLVDVNGKEQADWQSFIASIRALKPGDQITVDFIRDGDLLEKVVTIGASESGVPMIGVSAATEHIGVSLPDALVTSVGFIGYVAQAIVQLFNPATFQQTISQSSSVVGVSVEARNAASQGFMPFMILTAALSISIGLMNLLPIPPLDGGKVIVETIQRITRRAVSPRIVNYISMAGMALLLLLFFVCTTQDIQRYFFGG